MRCLAAFDRIALIHPGCNRLFVTMDCLAAGVWDTAALFSPLLLLSPPLSSPPLSSPPLPSTYPLLYSCILSPVPWTPIRGYPSPLRPANCCCPTSVSWTTRPPRITKDVLNSFSWSVNLAGRKRWWMLPPEAEPGLFSSTTGEQCFDLREPPAEGFDALPPLLGPARACCCSILPSPCTQGCVPRLQGAPAAAI